MSRGYSSVSWIGLALVLLASLPLHGAADAATFPIDFSSVGYEAGGTLPFVRARLAVSPTGGDDTALLQAALDQAGTLPAGADGFRGAVLLRAGRFHVKGQLKLDTNGVVLRGSGTGPAGTIIIAEGTGRRTLIEMGGSQSPALAPAQPVTSETVAAGASSFAVADVASFRPGDEVAIVRPSTLEWIRDIVMTGLPGTFANTRLDWTPGSHNLVWYRTVTKVDAGARRVEIDAPITTALERKYGGGTIARVESDVAPRRIGIENLVLESAYDRANLRDEEHSWIAIALDHVEDAWVRNVVARHFVSSAVRVNQRARRVTVENCRSEAPVSEPGGYRRQAFLVYGQQVLFHRCHSEAGMNDFATGLLAAGPNVFFDCDAAGSLGASGAFEGWASGVLYERVRVPDSRIALVLDDSRAQAAGWTAANSVAWNSTARSVDAIGPPGAPNFVVLSKESLYQTQLAARGLAVHAASAEMAVERDVPEFKGAVAASEPPVTRHKFEIVNGRIVIDGKAAWGDTATDAWWRSNTSPAVAGQLTGSSITRFVPGQTGPGLTEDLAELVARVKARGAVFYETIPGLWYDRRRDAHAVTRQPDGDVWAPFLEMAWARTGKGMAWDGLSKYDLSRYNPWYFERNREFAMVAGAEGLVVIHHLYNNHNVLEIGPHWIDYPWRPANNINDTGLPEPPPFKPDTRNIEPQARATVDALRLDVGNEFYSTAYAPLRKLHHDYIFHVLDELGDLPNVMFTVAYQYAGPLAFEQFFQDTAAEWEQLHHVKVRIALITSKQITDAILQDPIRSRQIAAVDMRYWQYRPDGALWAPVAGENRSYRQQIMEEIRGGWTGSPPPTTAAQVYRQVREYRDRYPGVALFPSEGGAGALPILMAGAASQSSLRVPAAAPPSVPTNAPPAARRNTDREIASFIGRFLAEDLMKMGPVDGMVDDASVNWVLADDAGNTILVYSAKGGTLNFRKQPTASRYDGVWFDPNTGATHDFAPPPGNDFSRVEKPDSNPWLLLLRGRR